MGPYGHRSKANSASSVETSWIRFTIDINYGPNVQALIYSNRKANSDAWQWCSVLDKSFEFRGYDRTCTDSQMMGII